MEDFVEILKIILPAGVVLFAMYLTVKTLTEKELRKKAMEIKASNQNTILPVRLQAYERVCLFLERIQPNNLILRLNKGSYGAREFHSILLQDIRDEYNHNLSQQVYMSDEAWNLTKNAKEDMIMVINQAAREMKENSKSVDLAKKIFEIVINKEVEPTSFAINKIKEEIRSVF
jgi:hypothetical protein